MAVLQSMAADVTMGCGTCVDCVCAALVVCGATAVWMISIYLTPSEQPKYCLHNPVQHCINQVRPELAIWDRLLLELCRQSSVECAPRGALLRRAVARQRALLGDALRCCDALWEGVSAVAAAGAQQRARLEAAGEERRELMRLMDDLKVGLDGGAFLWLVGLQPPRCSRHAW